MPRGILLTSNLPQLQNLIKRDPEAYREEFLQQWNRYNTIRQIFHLNPEQEANNFRELVSFISQLAKCYPKETAEFPAQLSALLIENYQILPPDIRRSFVQNLVMLRAKNVISSVSMLQTLFPLLPRTTSTSLRTLIRTTILSDIKIANNRNKNHKLNRVVQSMLFGMVERGMALEFVGDKGKAKAVSDSALGLAGQDAMWAVIFTKELWRKSIWNDTKSVAIIATACFHPVVKVQSASIHFFLGSNQDDDEMEPSDDEGPDLKTLQHRREVNKKTRCGDRKLEKQIKKTKKKRSQKSDSQSGNFPALQLLHDPQTFGERLYDNLSRYEKKLSLDHRIIIMQLLSRVMGSHKLCILGFYTYVVKYITYHQLNIPSILAALAQSVHELTPPDTLEPVIRKISQEFIHPGVGSEVIAAGLNTIREICRRQPWAMDEDLLGDLVSYRKSRDKTVTAAARGLLQLFREVNPGILKRRERGKEASMGYTQEKHSLPFGYTVKAAEDIDGLEFLEDHLKSLDTENVGEDSRDQQAWENWLVESDSDSSSEPDWINVDSDGADNLEISDSDSETADVEPVSTSSDQRGQLPAGVPSLATRKILTPADFALINDLRIKAATAVVEKTGGSVTKRKLAALEGNRKYATANSDFISENDILGPRKRVKADYAERIASIEKGREDREAFGSKKGKKNKEVPSSSTNKEKARNKPFMMIMSSGAVRGKKKASLKEKQQRLRRHIDKAKRSR
ncbi:SDA1-domain-containing protein [Thelephora terrestris]|uniref:Protein SDA1 n=1 Tax=Thelephora terrestris TaxID=56493 RepID=A0A9P6LC33_9AGAM|nr:SDA1-domain-containing protein [Thelephora terrestris]